MQIECDCLSEAECPKCESDKIAVKENLRCSGFYSGFCMECEAVFSILINPEPDSADYLLP